MARPLHCALAFRLCWDRLLLLLLLLGLLFSLGLDVVAGIVLLFAWGETVSTVARVRVGKSAYFSDIVKFVSCNERTDL